jgi:hypothetical protein
MACTPTSLLHTSNLNKVQNKLDDCDHRTQKGSVNFCMRFEVLTEVTTKAVVFLNVMACGLVDIYHSFRGICKPHVQGGSLFAF